MNGFPVIRAVQLSLLALFVIFSWVTIFQKADKDALSNYLSAGLLLLFLFLATYNFGRALAKGEGGRVVIPTHEWATAAVVILLGASVIGSLGENGSGFVVMISISAFALIGLLLGGVLGTSEAKLLRSGLKVSALEDAERSIKNLKWENEFANESLEDYRNELVEADCLIEEAHIEVSQANEEVRRNIDALSRINDRELALELILQSLLDTASDLTMIQDKLHHHVQVLDERVVALNEIS